MVPSPHHATEAAEEERNSIFPAPAWSVQRVYAPNICPSFIPVADTKNFKGPNLVGGVLVIRVVAWKDKRTTPPHCSGSHITTVRGTSLSLPCADSAQAQEQCVLKLTKLRSK